MKIESSAVIERPVGDVWDFYAENHVRNHPRWDTTLQLEKLTEGPMGVGTVIKRTVDRFGRVTEGTMEVTEYEPGRVMRVRTQDGPMHIDGWALFEALGDEETRLTIGGDIPGIDDATGEMIQEMMDHSAATIKDFVESEY